MNQNKLDEYYRFHKLPLNAKCVFKGELFDVYHWEQEMFDGSFKTFEKIVREGSVQLICITKENKIILYNEEQPHIGKFISLPGGQVDTEDIIEAENIQLGFENAAKRELLEETGMECSSIELFHQSELMSKISWPTSYYIVKGCHKVQDTNLEVGEKIEINEVDFDEFIEKTQDKNFRNKYFTQLIFNMMNKKGELKEFKNKLFNHIG